MQTYEYKIIPAPTKGRKGPGVKGPEARFAHGLEEAVNALAVEGWEYLRADILPSEERQGLTSSQTVYRSVLVFRRAMVPTATDQSDALPWDGMESTAPDSAAEAAAIIAEDVDNTTIPDPEPAASEPVHDALADGDGHDIRRG